MKDRSKGLGNLPVPKDQNARTHEQIYPGSQRHQNFCRCADPSGTAQKRQSHRHRKEQSDSNAFANRKLRAETVEYLIQSGRNGVNLRGVSHTEGSNDTKKTIKICKKSPSFPHAARNHVHGAANPFTVNLLPVAHSQSRLSEF